MLALTGPVNLWTFINDLLYLGGFFIHPVVSFAQFSYTVCCSEGIKIF